MPSVRASVLSGLGEAAGGADGRRSGRASGSPGSIPPACSRDRTGRGGTYTNLGEWARGK
jgi:hypothetical protein